MPSATGATHPNTPTACGECCKQTSRRTSFWLRVHLHNSGFLAFTFEHVGLNWQEYVKFDAKFLRPTEVDELMVTRRKPRRLGWEATVLPPELAKIMVDADIARLGGAPEGQF